jgi:hypothetical protein
MERGGGNLRVPVLTGKRKTLGFTLGVLVVSVLRISVFYVL